MGLPIFREPDSEREKPTNTSESTVHDRTTIRRQASRGTRRSRSGTSTRDLDAAFNLAQFEPMIYGVFELNDLALARRRNRSSATPIQPSVQDQPQPNPEIGSSSSRPRSRRGPVANSLDQATTAASTALSASGHPPLRRTVTRIGPHHHQTRNHQEVGFQFGERIGGLGDRDRSWSPDTEDLEYYFAIPPRRPHGEGETGSRTEEMPRSLFRHSLLDATAVEPRAARTPTLAEMVTEDEVISTRGDTEHNAPHPTYDPESLFCEEPDLMPATILDEATSQPEERPTMSPFAVLRRASELYHQYQARIEGDGTSGMSAVEEEALMQEVEDLTRHLRRSGRHARVNINQREAESDGRQLIDHARLELGRL